MTVICGRLWEGEDFQKNHTVQNESIWEDSVEDCSYSQVVVTSRIRVDNSGDYCCGVWKVPIYPGTILTHTRLTLRKAKDFPWRVGGCQVLRMEERCVSHGFM